MKIGVLEIFNYLHNNPPEVVAVKIRDEADNVAGSLVILDMVLEVKETYPKEIEQGAVFSILFSKHFEKKQEGTLPEKPAMKTRASNFSKAIFRFVVEGMPISSKEKAHEKLAICESNECGYFDGSICRHTKCGCFAKIKTFFETEHCPIGKW